MDVKYKTLILRKEKQIEYIYSLHINIYVCRHVGDAWHSEHQTVKNCYSRKGNRPRAMEYEERFHYLVYRPLFYSIIFYDEKVFVYYLYSYKLKK